MNYFVLENEKNIEQETHNKLFSEKKISTIQFFPSKPIYMCETNEGLKKMKKRNLVKEEERKFIFFVELIFKNLFKGYKV